MRIPVKKSTSLLGVAALAASLSLTACGGDSGGSDNGNTVTIWSSIDQPVQDGLLKALEAKVGSDIKIDWKKVENINQLIMTKIQAGDTPDIAFIPQPGVVKDMVSLDAIKPLDDVVPQADQDSMIPGTLDAGTVDGKLYGLLVSANVKGLIFYPKKAWEAKGWPTEVASIDELNQLTETIKADGETPWCMGIESDTATGWPATDWFETLVAKYGGVDEYNSWVAGDTKFDSDIVKQAAAEFEQLMFTDGNVLGGREAIASTNFGTAGNPMFDAKPGCWMYNQGSFITGFFPDEIKSDLDANVGVMGFPPATAGGDNPVIGGGDMATLLNDSDNAKKVMAALAATDIGNDAAGSSSFISPHSDFDPANYADETSRSYAKVASESTGFLFDGSDQMPGEVGAGTFWKDMTAWISGQEDLDTALKNIDASWPS
ncbi:carbohydrate ABC transporter substrate-binding protein [Nocardioides agariphilus]|jgi:alpha-glucoside transport system substrate-binding protein|uniref:Carbohydrate ABC transporter substrate-binding protein n=1 Tax=Nocardioides agariphilus TaxID=433664 RepID=A0A930YIQ0_9ACTN|nr:ABC transporter substrate-binding protein [Nocardioides agariphilus]MBF4768417.1 carbohydrate ABC transporter substrate-binding protein [Nocardioides agariphilus]